MKIVMTLLVRDEADIVEHFLVYHLNQGVDRVLVLDDGSTDRTRELLDSFRKADLVTVVPRSSGTWLEDEPTWRTQLARQAATDHGADWVLTGDADEFWWPVWGNLKDVLASVPAERESVIAPRNDFAFVSPPERNPLQDFTVRERQSPLRPKLAFRASSAVTVFSGAHRVSLGPDRPTMTDTQIGRPLRISPTGGLRIFHYGVRSDAQFDRLRGGPGPGRRSPALRDPLYRRAIESTSSPDLGDGWRSQVLRQGLAAGELVIDDRVAAFYESCLDPRVHDRRNRELSKLRGPLDPAEATDELLEVNALIFDHLQAEDAKLLRRIERLRAKVLKERQARRRKRLGVRRALGALSPPWSPTVRAVRRRLRGRRAGVRR